MKLPLIHLPDKVEIAKQQYNKLGVHIHKMDDNIGTQNNYYGEAPDTQQLVAELDELLQSIAQQIPDPNSEAAKEIITAAAIEEIETNKTSLRDRLAAAFKAGTFEAIKQFAKNPFV